MTDLAGRGETRRSMRRTVGAGVILLMARIAQNAGQAVVIVDVTICAGSWRYGVRTRQCESGGRVVKSRVTPGHGIVADFARSRETRCRVVHWRRRIVEVLLVARHAGRAGEVVVVVDVAIGALPRRHR